jgi:hypothetical protein
MGSADNCRVCGYDWGEPPWGESGQEPTFWICPCCEVEAGYEDGDVASAKAYRAAWIAAGAQWSDDDEPEDGLSTEERLTHVPPGFE